MKHNTTGIIVFALMIGGALGALGLCLAGIGLYAVVAFAVSRRSRRAVSEDRPHGDSARVKVWLNRPPLAGR